MAVADVDKFFATAAQHPDVMARLQTGPTDPASMYGRIVAEGKLLGFTFSAADAEEYMDEKQSAAAAPVPMDRRARTPQGPTGILGIHTNPSPGLPPFSSFDAFQKWFGDQLPKGHGRRR